MTVSPEMSMSVELPGPPPLLLMTTAVRWTAGSPPGFRTGFATGRK